MFLICLSDYFWRVHSEFLSRSLWGKRMLKDNINIEKDLS